MVPPLKKQDHHLCKRMKFGPPKTGHVPIVTMTMHWDKFNSRVRVLLDSGSTVSKVWAESMGIRRIRRPVPKEINNYAGQPVEGAGEYLSNPLLLQHKSYYTREAVEKPIKINNKDPKEGETHVSWHNVRVPRDRANLDSSILQLANYAGEVFGTQPKHRWIHGFIFVGCFLRV